MTKAIEEAKKALVLEAFDTLFNKRRHRFASPQGAGAGRSDRGHAERQVHECPAETRRLACLFGVPQAALTERASRESRSL